MRFRLFVSVVLTLLSGFARGQSLANVLNSLQDRQRVLNQKNGVYFYLKGDAFNPQGSNGNLINWDPEGSIHESVTDAQINALSISQKIGFLNKAISEFDRLKIFFININPSDLSSANTSKKVAALRRYHFTDFESLPQATPENYNQIVAELGLRVHKLQVLPWAFKAKPVRKSWSFQKPAIVSNGFSAPVQTGPPGDPSNLPDEAINMAFDNWGAGDVRSVDPGPSNYYDKITVGYVETYYFSQNNLILDLAHQAPEGATPNLEDCTLTAVERYLSGVEKYSKTGRQNEIDGQVVMLSHTLPLWSNATQLTIGGNVGNWDVTDGSYHILSTVEDSPDFADPQITTYGTCRHITPPPQDDDEEDDEDSGQGGYSEEPATTCHFFPTGMTARSENGSAQKMSGMTWVTGTDLSSPIGGIISREIFAVYVPDFSNGVDDPTEQAKLAETENILTQPGGDGSLELNPEPGVLFSINLGAGLDGKGRSSLVVNASRQTGASTAIGYGFSSIDQCWPESVYLTTDYGTSLYPGAGYRYDFQGNLRFSGSAMDFKVIYDGNRKTSVASGISALPKPPFPQNAWKTDLGSYDYVSTLLEWDLPRIRQVVGRDLIADISYNGYFESVVNIYRIPLSAGISRGNVEEVLPNVGSYPLVRTYVIKNPDVDTEDPSKTTGPERLIITDSANPNCEYEIKRSSGNLFGATTTLSVRQGGEEKYSTVIVNATTNPSSESTVTTTVDKVQAPTSSFSNNWDWTLPYPASSSTTVTGTGPGADTVTVTTSVDSGHKGTRNGIFPDSVTISHSKAGFKDQDFGFNRNPDGFLTSCYSGAGSGAVGSEVYPWKFVADISGDDANESIYRKGVLYQKSQTSLKDDQTSPASKYLRKRTAISTISNPADGIEQTIYFDDRPGLISKIKNKDGTGSSYLYTPSSASTVVETRMGPFDGTSITRGFRNVKNYNQRGYLVSSEDRFGLTSGSDLQIAKIYNSNDLTTWGAPKSFFDQSSGKQTSLTYEGNLDRISQVVDPLDVTTSYGGYDALGRLKSYTWNGATGQIAYSPEVGGSPATVPSISHTLNFGGSDTLQYSASAAFDGSAYSSSVSRGGATSAVAGTKTTSEEKVTESNSIPGGAGTFNSSVDHKFDPATGSLLSSAGNVIPFGGALQEEDSMESGLLKIKRKVNGAQGCYETRWTDSLGRLVKIASPSTSGTGEDITTFAYNSPSSPIQYVTRTDASGVVSQVMSDPWSTPGAMVSMEGVKLGSGDTLTTSDRYTKTTTTISGGHIVVSAVAKEDSGSREVSRVEIDPLTKAVTSTFNGETTTSLGAPNYNDKTITGSTGGYNFDIHFDSLGNVTQSNLWEGAANLVKTTQEYRRDGSLSSATYEIGGAEEGTTSASFTSAGLLSQLSVPHLGTVFSGFDFSSGKVASTVNGHTSSSNYDGTDVSAGGDKLGSRVQTSVGSNSFTASITPDSGSAAKTQYNLAGAPTSHEYPGGTAIGYTWYPGGLLHTKSLARGGQIVYGYTSDAAKDLNSVTWPAVVDPLFETINTTGVGLGYDASGRLNLVTDEAGSRTLGYDHGRVNTTEYTSGPLNGYKVTRSFDASGHESGVTLRKNGTIIHTLNYVPVTSGTVTTGEISGVNDGGSFSAFYTKTATKRLTKITRGSQVQNWIRLDDGYMDQVNAGSATLPAFTYTYSPSPSGRQIQKVNTDGHDWTYTYGTGGQLTQATHASNGTFNYAFDAAGRRTKSGAQPDPQNRLLSLTHASPRSLTAKADSSARLWINGLEVVPFTGTATKSFDLQDAGYWQPWDVKGVLAGGGATGAGPNREAEKRGYVWMPPKSEDFTYDADGNRRTSAQWIYGWNAKNELVRAQTTNYSGSPEGWKLTFAYDSEGRRISKVATHRITYGGATQETTTETSFVWDGWNLLYERQAWQGSSTAIYERKYIWGEDLGGGRYADEGVGGAGGLLLMRETRNGSTTDYYPFYDGIGHVIGITTSAGTTVARYTYGPFGETITATGPMAESNPWRFATKYYDAETRLSYFGHRYYDPTAGQWLNRDPMGEGESVNLYSYCGNDPINKIDRLGSEETSGNGWNVFSKSFWIDGTFENFKKVFGDPEKGGPQQDSLSNRSALAIAKVVNDVTSENLKNPAQAVIDRNSGRTSGAINYPLSMFEGMESAKIESEIYLMNIMAGSVQSDASNAQIESGVVRVLQQGDDYSRLSGVLSAKDFIRQSIAKDDAANVNSSNFGFGEFQGQVTVDLGLGAISEGPSIYRGVSRLASSAAKVASKGLGRLADYRLVDGFNMGMGQWESNVAYRSLDEIDIARLRQGQGLVPRGSGTGLRYQAMAINGYDTGYISVTETFVRNLERGDPYNYIKFRRSGVAYINQATLENNKLIAGKLLKWVKQQSHGLVSGEIPFESIIDAVINGKKIK